MKIFRKENIKNWILAVISLIIGAVSLMYLPEEIPTHFNASGVVDDWGSKYTIFLFPGLMFLFIILAEVFKNIDPKKDNYEKFKSFYYSFFFLFNMLMLVAEITIISYTLSVEKFNTTNIILCAVGVLFAAIGNMLPKIKPNYYMGIKTSWALADSNNWYKTHRLGGKVWTVGGILMIFIPFLCSENVTSVVFFVIIMVMCIIPAIASYMYYVKDNK